MKNYVKRFDEYYVPESAVYYTPETNEYILAFYDKDRKMIAYCEKGAVHLIDGFSAEDPDELIELPTEQEFVPEVGEWCESTDGLELFFIGLDTVGNRIFEMKNGELTTTNDRFKFRPIRSEREKLIDVIVSVGNMSEGVLADAILSAGFKLPDPK